MIATTCIKTEGKLVARVALTRLGLASGRTPSFLWAISTIGIARYTRCGATAREMGASGRSPGRPSLPVPLASRDGAWMGDNQADAPVHHASNSDNFVVVTEPNERRVRR